MSSKEEVLDVLRSEKNKAGNPDKRLSDWKDSLNSLFESFRLWLEPLKAEKLATVEERDSQITEPGLGTYRVPEITIQTLKGETILIQPRGRNIVGAAGRVDFVRDPKKTILIRDSKAPHAWRFAEASREKRRWEYEDLTEESFFAHLKELIAE